MYNIGEDGETVYVITNPTISYQVTNSLKLKVDYTVKVTVSFAGEVLYWMEIPMTVTSSLTLKE